MTTTKKQTVQVPLADLELAIATAIIRTATTTDDLKCQPQIQLDQGTLHFLFDIIGPQTFAAYCSKEATLEELLKHIHKPTLWRDSNRYESRISVTIETSGDSLFQQRSDYPSFRELLERVQGERKKERKQKRDRVAEAQELLQSEDLVHQCIGRLLMYLIHFYPWETFGYETFKRGVGLRYVSSAIVMRTIKQDDLRSPEECWLESVYSVSWDQFKGFLLAKNREFEVVQVVRESGNPNPDPDIEAILGDDLDTALLWRD